METRLIPPRAGFSLIEALVVLAISGMALAVIFSIGTKAGDTGFGLGRRAMAASESDLSIGDLRSLIRSVALRPPSTFQADTDVAAVGTPTRLEVDVVMERANLCGPLGWAGRLVLIVETEAGRSRLICEAAGRRNVIMELGFGAAQFSYSTTGRDWMPTYSNAPLDGQAATQIRSETVWVRLASDEMGDVIEMATSGPADTWVRFGRDL